jgi:ubiquinone/menaquinone biosynthesis C-methylase UbiE
MGMGANRSNSRMVIELAGIKAGDKVLDVGCGTGSLTLTAKAYAGPGGAVYGIDAAPEMIETARNKAAQAGMQVNFEVGLMEAGFVEVRSRPTRSSFLGYVSGKKAEG